MPSTNYYSIAVRVHQRERFACKRAAELAGMTVSAWSRKTLVGALHPTDFDAGDVHAEDSADADGGVGHGDHSLGNVNPGPLREVVDEPEDAAQDGDESLGRLADEPPKETAETDAAPGRLAEAHVSSMGLPGGDRANAVRHNDVQPLTFNKADLCPRCQRMGPSCQKCRALVRGRKLA